MENNIYPKKVIEHFQNPHNYGKMKNPDATGKAGNIICGDVFWLYIKVRENKKGEEIIEDVKFETYGCVAAIATSSIITDMIKGETLKEALKINKKQVTDSLGGLPRIKLHCSVLAVDGLSEAVYNYFQKNKREIPKELQERHQRIKKEKEKIKKEHKEWVKAEEKAHKEDE